MIKTIINFLINGLAVLITGYLLPGVVIGDYGVALLTALVLGLLNVLVKPFLVFLSLPITVLTLGFFIIVIDAIVILLAAAIVPGFSVSNFLSAVLFALVLAVVSYIFQAILGL